MNKDLLLTTIEITTTLIAFDSLFFLHFLDMTFIGVKVNVAHFIFEKFVSEESHHMLVIVCDLSISIKATVDPCIEIHLVHTGKMKCKPSTIFITRILNTIFHRKIDYH